MIPASLLSLSLVSMVYGPTEERRIRVEVDHSALLDKQRASTAEDTAFFIDEGCAKALGEIRGVTMVDGEDAPTIIVSLIWVDYVDSIYGVTIETRRPGGAVELVESFGCECYDDELTAAVVERLPAALVQLDEVATVADESAAAAVVEPEQAAEEEEEAGSEIEATPDRSGADGSAPSSRNAAPIGALGVVGIVAGVGGLGMAGFGVSRLAVGQRDQIDGGEEEIGRIRDFRPQGRRWLGAGLGVAAAGVIMLVVDLKVLRKRRAAKLAVTPSFGLAGAGLVWSGRF